MALRTRVWSAGKLLVLAGALGVTFLVFALLGMRLALRAREVDVPNLVGTAVDAASTTVADLGLSLRVDPNARPDAQVPAGHVILQDPVAGTQVRQQRTIRVWVSAGSKAASMPTFVGQNERTARLAIDADGLGAATISEFRSPDYPSDAVVAQDPMPGALGPRVSLLVNRGEQAETFVMPDLVGTPGNRAAEILRARGFRVSIVGSQAQTGVQVDTVVRHQPAAGFQVGLSDAISLEVSR
jgi:serine/threonine-protein kinase